jgi:DnaJ-class molecular chaperone
MADYCRKCRSELVVCPRCKGKGTTLQRGGILLPTHKEVPCPNCKGTGKLCPKHGYDHG